MHVHFSMVPPPRYDFPVPAFEYRHATWDEVCDLGPQGWRLVAVPPIQEVKQVLGQPQLGELLYAIERETPAPIEFHVAGMSHLGSLGAAADEVLRQEDGQPAPAGESAPQ